MTYLIYIALIAVLVVAGRIETFDVSEGQALINGWPYWSAACLASLLMLSRDVRH